MVEHVWTRSHDTHFSSQHVEELWQLVNVGLAHEVAEGKLSRVVLRSLYLVCSVVDVHGSELVADECLAVESCPFLSEENPPRALYLDNQGNDGNER